MVFSRTMAFIISSRDDLEVCVYCMIDAGTGCRTRPTISGRRWQKVIYYEVPSR